MSRSVCPVQRPADHLLPIGTSHAGNMATERFVFDAVAAALMLATALAGAWLPKYLGAGRPHNSGHLPHSHIDPGRSTAFQLGNMLSAGVMLSAGFCHLLVSVGTATVSRSFLAVLADCMLPSASLGSWHFLLLMKNCVLQAPASFRFVFL